jgi:hypothetical protein
MPDNVPTFTPMDQRVPADREITRNGWFTSCRHATTCVGWGSVSALALFRRSAPRVDAVGGEQQMLLLGTEPQPSLLLADEPARARQICSQRSAADYAALALIIEQTPTRPWAC